MFANAELHKSWDASFACVSLKRSQWSLRSQVRLWAEWHGSDLQDSDVAFLSAEVEARLPQVVSRIHIGTQLDQVGHHQVMIVIRCMQQGGLGKDSY